MIKVQYPEWQPRIKTAGNNEQIFDEIRRRWVALTPEEWVRQHTLRYLVQVKQYPAALIAVEKVHRLNDLVKRTDIVVYNQRAQPWMLIECKEMNVVLDENVLNQALRYHLSIPVSFLVITNGIYCYGFEKAGMDFKEIEAFPAYPDKLFG